MTLTLVGGNTPESLSPPPMTLFPGCGNARRSRRLIRQPKPSFGTSAIIPDEQQYIPEFVPVGRGARCAVNDP